MKIMKLLAACAMVGALATTTAMAAESDFLGEYDATNNAIAINLAAEDVADYAKTATGDLTVLVTNVDAAGTISNTNIFQIDQGTLASLENDTDENADVKLAVLKLSAAVAADYTAVTTKAEGAPASSTYYVRLGGAESGYIYDTFTFAVPEEDEPETTPKMIGDFSADLDITPTDVTLLCEFLSDIYSDFEDIDFYAAGYADGDSDITPTDVTLLCEFLSDIEVDNVALMGDFYYDEADEVYYVYGDLYE